MGRLPARAQHRRTTKPKRNFPNILLGPLLVNLVLAVLLAASTPARATMATLFPAPPSHIIIAGGPGGGSYEQYTMKYREIPARSYVKVDAHDRLAGAAGEPEAARRSDLRRGLPFVLGGFAKGVKVAGCKIAGPGSNMPQVLSFYRASERLTDLVRAQEQVLREGPAGSGTRIIAEMVLRRTALHLTTRPSCRFQGFLPLTPWKAAWQTGSSSPATRMPRQCSGCCAIPDDAVAELEASQGSTRNFPFLT